MAAENEPLLRNAHLLQGLSAAHAAEAEVAGTLSAPVVQAIADAGLFSMLVPRELGGHEADVSTMIKVVEAVSQGDGAAGWCLMISATTGTTAAQLPKTGAQEIFGDPRTAAGGVLMPPGKARRVEGGFAVSGRWRFGSGSGHAAWMMGGCVVHGPDGPEMLGDNVPNLRMMFFPKHEAIIHDTWHVSGLRGTGSNDFEVQELFIPEHHSTPTTNRDRWTTSPLYVFPLFGLLALGVASVALGIGRGAIETLKDLAGAKTPTGSRRVLAERGAVQSGIAEAEALVSTSRAFMLETVDDIWRRVSDGERMTLVDRAQIRLAATTAARYSAQAVDICYNLGGATSIYESSTLQRAFRDIHTVTQHVMVGQPTLEVAGRVLLGMPTDPSML